jgi:hypothetical protein
VAGIFISGFADGALEPKQPISPTVRFINAALISLDLFLPIADIPTVGEWRVSSGTIWGVPWLTLWATFMIVTEWILVPIGIAGLTGQLKR